MQLPKTAPSSWGIILILFAFSLLLVTCGADDEQGAADVEPCEKEALVDSVEVEERNGEYYAVVKGNHRDACTKTSTITQEIDGDTINVNVCTTRPEGMVCAQMLAPYEEEILLDTEGLSSGEYTVDVNGVAAAFSIP